MEMLFRFMGLFNILIFFGSIVFVIWVAVSMLNTMKERNEILKEIRDEMRSEKQTT